VVKLARDCAKCGPEVFRKVVIISDDFSWSAQAAENKPVSAEAIGPAWRLKRVKFVLESDS
jgi:hypothetical protein